MMKFNLTIKNSPCGHTEPMAEAVGQGSLVREPALAATGLD